MLKYCRILDEETGRVQLGAGCSDEYYKSIGMVERDVEQSEKDFSWYLTEKCPHYTEEEKRIMEIQNEVFNLKANLNEIDFKSIRAIRSNDTEYIKKYEEQAEVLRVRIRELENQM